jgi:glycosyltransferase involved in cell wall biosynthesis
MAVMNSKPLKELVTIIIPCKNEEGYIDNLLESLYYQYDLGNDNEYIPSGVQIYVADAKSTDNTVKQVELWRNSHHTRFPLNIKIIEGGNVSFARNNGASLATTPYLLFIDADVIFFNKDAIYKAVSFIEKNNLDLVTFKIKSYSKDIRSKIAYSLFNFFNSILSIKIPFAPGAFFLTKATTFRSLGGFPQKHAATEDFILSKKYNISKFKIMNRYYGQDDRRFKKMGYIGMVKYMLTNFWNRNNQNYLNNTDNFENYWK